MSSKVINIKKENLSDYPNGIYIGRANKWLGLPESKWHNPFPMKKESDRPEVIRKFREYILSREDLMNSLEELDGKVLGCYCSPKNCHGHVLLELLEVKKNEYK